MFRKRFHLIPEHRNEPCDHFLAFRYQGRVPCTGPRVCDMCGATEAEVAEHEQRTRAE